MRKILVLLLTVLILLSTAFAQESAPLFTYNGTDVSGEELARLTEAYAQLGAVSSETDFDGAIRYMIRNQLAPEAKAHELGLDVYTEEELAAIKAEADAYYEQQVEAYVQYYAPEMAEADKEELRAEIRAYWAEMGTTVESAEDTHLFNKTKERLLATMDIETTDAEIEALFLQQAAKDEAYFKDNVPAYEFYTFYRNYDIWYVPEGFRRVKQIMLCADEEDSKAYAAAVKAGEGVKEAADTILAKKQDTIDAIYNKLAEGVPFEELMAAYNEDPQTADGNVAYTYEVHPETSVWPEEFTEAAFSEKMTAPGSVSDPAVSSYGVHILCYVEDVPSGIVPLTDEIRESLAGHLIELKQDEIIDSWADEYELVIHEDALDALKASAAAVSEG